MQRAYLPLLLAIGLLSCAGLLYGCSSSQSSEEETKYVLVISIDGLSPSMLNDPRAPVPTLRHLAQRGVVASEGMRISNPTLTWPTHTSMVTGSYADSHTLLFNGVLEGLDKPNKALRINPDADRDQLFTGRTIYDAAYEAGLTTAEVNWPSTRNTDTLDFSFPDTTNAFAHTTPAWREELVAQGIIPADQAGWSAEMGSSATRDHIWTQAAEHLVRHHQPQLLFLHLLNVDATHHQYGEHTSAGYTAIALADAQIARLLKTIDAVGIGDKTTVFVVSDHGFKNADRVVFPNVILRELGLIEFVDDQLHTHRAQAVTVGGSAMIYLLSEESKEEDRQLIVETFEEAEGIARIITPEEYPDYRLPTSDESEEAPDLIIEAAPGYAFDEHVHHETPVLHSAKAGYHGYLANRDAMNALFIASGSGITTEVDLDLVEIVDVAPTIAKLLEIDFEATDGHSLDAILED